MLSLTNINPNVKYIDTRKKFFGRYLYKIKINVPAARIIISKGKASIPEELAERRRLIEYRQKFNRYWGDRDSLSIRNASESQLAYYIDILKKFKDQIKIRVEEPDLTIYSEDKDLLFAIAQGDLTGRITEFHRPASAEAEAALNRGEVIIKKPVDYEYKVVFKEGYSALKGQGPQVCDYLYSLGDQVKMTKSCIKNLTSRSYWYSSIYFYCKDPSITTFLTLIAPGSIAGIYKLAILDE